MVGIVLAFVELKGCPFNQLLLVEHLLCSQAVCRASEILQLLSHTPPLPLYNLDAKPKITNKQMTVIQYYGQARSRTVWELSVS